MKLIIADDSDMMRNRIRNLLRQNPNVEIAGEAKNGIEALQLVLEHQPDLLILDFKMPGLNGLEVMKKIKSEGNKAKICILTNYPYPQYREKCFDEGADYFFNKADDFEKINLAIEDVLRDTGEVSLTII